MIDIRIDFDPVKCLPLFKAAGAEVGIAYEIEPDWDRYRQAIAEGNYLFAVAIDGNIPVGYIGVILDSCLFNSSVTHAIVDSYYVLPEYRKSTVPGRLIGKIMPTVEAVAYDIVFQCGRDDALAAVLKKRGFKELEVSFQKRI